MLHTYCSTCANAKRLQQPPPAFQPRTPLFVAVLARLRVVLYWRLKGGLFVLIACSFYFGVLLALSTRSVWC